MRLPVEIASSRFAFLAIQKQFDQRAMKHARPAIQALVDPRRR
jgi:hypothetical protein